MARRLRHGAADLPALQREFNRLTHGRVAQSYPLATQAANTEHSIHLQAVALWLLAGLLALVGLLVLGQVLARLSFLDAPGYGSLRALGMSRPALVAAGLGRAALIGAAGAVLGALAAVAASPLFPVGLAGVAEPYPGVHADAAVLALGAVGTVLVTVACAGWPSWRVASVRTLRAGTAPPARARQGWLAALPTAGGRPVTAVIGVRLALQRGAGRTALPVRSTIASVVVGVAAITAAVVFSASLGHLLATPPLYGVTWNAYVSSETQSPVTPAARVASHDPSVSGWSLGYAGAPLYVDGIRADAMAMLPGHHGSMLPVGIGGHLPDQPGQIALGERTMAAIHARVGGTVRVSLAGGRARPLRITGAAIFPTLSDALGLGQGAALSVAGLYRLLPAGVPAPPPDTLLVRFHPGGGPAALGRLVSRETRAGPFVVQGPATPTDLVNFGRVQDLPLLLGVALSLLALLTIVHLLLTSVRRRRRDFAVLRSLGFTRRQVRGAVSWQAGTLTGAALCLGLPAGILGGRLAWRVFAHQLGIEPAMVVPLAGLAGLVLAALALALVIAAVPGESAARDRPAQILRSE